MFDANTFCIFRFSPYPIPKPAMLLSMYTLTSLDLILTRVVLPTPICIKVCLARVIVQLFV